VSSLAASTVLYIECDVPAGMTLREWRAERAGATSQAGFAPMSGVLRRLRRVRRARRREG
jgi:hypothetical protein